jgi:hypothetical protein
MNEDYETIDRNRAAWVAKGRPADPADPYWASVLVRQAEAQAEAEERRARQALGLPPRLVQPLLTFG